MNVEQIYTKCLAQASYYIESEGEVAIVDPLRETKPYLDRAAKNNVRIRYIFETHFHADFVSGHLDLAQKTGAEIVYGPTSRPDFPCRIVKDGEEIKLGNVIIKALHTPGHTLESTTYLLLNEQGEDHAIFTGDTLLLGDVGRPDLAQKAAHMTQEELAGLLYDSLFHKIMPLHDNTIIYPAHGKGSACGKNMMDITIDILGHQKNVNYALREGITKEEFIREVTDGLGLPPAYFRENVALNKHGYESLDRILNRGLTACSPDDFEHQASNSDVVVLDTRDARTFAKAFIPGSINIGLDGDFAVWVGALLPGTRTSVLLVVEKGREEEAVTRLSRVGYDHTLGYLEGGIENWKKSNKKTDSIHTISAHAFQEYTAQHEAKVIDLRKPFEYELNHMKNAINLPLDTIYTSLEKFPDEGEFYIHCAGGYRSMMAASILKSKGRYNFIEVTGGVKAMAEAGIELVDV